MKKFLTSLCICTVAIIWFGISAFAGCWVQEPGRPANENGVTNWWWRNSDGSYPANQWAWIDGNGDGLAESYYFDANGYMLAAPAVIDGYTVNESGAWTKNGAVQVFPNSWVPGGNVLTADTVKNTVESRYNPIDGGYSYDKATHSSLTDQQAYDILMQIKNEYPDGTPWGEDELYISGNRYGYGCAAFVFIVQERLYGTPVKPYKDYSLDLSSWRVGDHIRVKNNQHSVILLSKTADSITVAEANYGNAVRWGRVISLDKLSREFAYRETCY